MIKKIIIIIILMIIFCVPAVAYEYSKELYTVKVTATGSYILSNITYTVDLSGEYGMTKNQDIKISTEEFFVISDKNNLISALTNTIYGVYNGSIRTQSYTTVNPQMRVQYLRLPEVYLQTGVSGTNPTYTWVQMTSCQLVGTEKGNDVIITIAIIFVAVVVILIFCYMIWRFLK